MEKKCGNCGKPRENTNRCPFCGVLYSKAAAYSKAEAEEKAAEEAWAEIDVELNATAEEDLPLDPPQTSMLVECKTCGKEISINASACPGCGEPVNKEKNTTNTAAAPKKKGAASGCLVIVGIIMAVGFFSALFDDSPSTSSKARKDRVNAITGNNCKTKSGYMYGINRDYFDKAMTMLVNKDNLALTKLQQAGVVGFLKPGIKVYREDVSIMSGAIKIRPEGETVEVWTNLEAVECK